MEKKCDIYRINCQSYKKCIIFPVIKSTKGRTEGIHCECMHVEKKMGMNFSSKPRKNRKKKKQMINIHL